MKFDDTIKIRNIFYKKRMNFYVTFNLLFSSLIFMPSHILIHVNVLLMCQCQLGLALEWFMNQTLNLTNTFIKIYSNESSAIQHRDIINEHKINVWDIVGQFIKFISKKFTNKVLKVIFCFWIDRYSNFYRHCS